MWWSSWKLGVKLFDSRDAEISFLDIIRISRSSKQPGSNALCFYAIVAYSLDTIMVDAADWRFAKIALA